MRSNIKLCFISHSSGLGGAEKAFPVLLNRLKLKGIDILVIIPDHGPVETDLKKNGLKYKIIPYRMWMSQNNNIIGRFKRFYMNIKNFRKVYTAIKNFNCDIIYTNTCTQPIGGIVAKILGKPHIWHFREFGYEDHKFIYDLGEKISLKLTNYLSTYCIANSHAVAFKYSKYIELNKIEVIYESYDENKGTPAPFPEHLSYDKNIYRIICVIIGSVYPTKGHLDAINAIAHLKRNNIEVQLYIVGNGKQQFVNFLKEEVKKLGIDKNIIFTGHISHVEKMLDNFDLLLMCSKSEAYGLVTLEAMKAGIPVIGTNSGGTPELIQDGKNGFLYNHGNVKQLAEKIEYFFRNPSKLREMGEYGKFLAETNLKAENYYEGIYKVLLRFSPNFK